MTILNGYVSPNSTSSGSGNSGTFLNTPANSGSVTTSTSNPYALENGQLYSQVQNTTAAQQSAQAQTPQGLLSTASNLNSLSGAFGGPTASTGGGLLNSVTSAVNNFGASYLGTGLPATTVASTVAAPTYAAGGESLVNASSALTGYDAVPATAGAVTSASLTSLAGAAGLGYFGGSELGKLLGDNPNQQTASGIGGAIGAGIGDAVAGPIGGLVGGVLGSLAGGLFGGAPPTDGTEVGGVSLANGQVNPVYQQQESDTGSKYNANNAANAATMQTGASNLAQWLLANGATPNANTQQYNPNLVIKVGVRDGIQIGTQNEANGSNSLNYTTTLPSNATAAQTAQAVSNTVLSQYNIPPALQAQLKNMNLTNFYSPNYNSSNSAATNSASTTTNGVPNFVTPTVNDVNLNGRGLLQTPSNTTGQ